MDLRRRRRRRFAQLSAEVAAEVAGALELLLALLHDALLRRRQAHPAIGAPQCQVLVGCAGGLQPPVGRVGLRTNDVGNGDPASQLVVPATVAVGDEVIAAARSVPEVLGIETVLGRIDVRLNVIARDMGHYQQVYRERILSLPHIAEVEALMLISTVKDSEGLPL